jgi:hypothetical protein
VCANVCVQVLSAMLVSRERSTSPSGVTVVLPWCSSGITMVLQWCSIGFTIVSQYVTVSFERCYSAYFSAGIKVVLKK